MMVSETGLEAGKPRKKLMSQFKDIQAGEILSYSGTVSLFAIWRLSTDWIRPTHVREDNLLYSVYLFKCQSHPKILLQEYPE